MNVELESAWQRVQVARLELAYKIIEQLSGEGKATALMQLSVVITELKETE